MMQSDEFFEAKAREDEISGALFQAIRHGALDALPQIEDDLKAAQAYTMSLFDPIKEPMWVEMRQSLGLPTMLGKTPAS